MSRNFVILREERNFIKLNIESIDNHLPKNDS